MRTSDEMARAVSVMLAAEEAVAKARMDLLVAVIAEMAMATHPPASTRL